MFQVENKGSYCTINSKTLKDGLKGFGIKRAFFEEFKRLESSLSSTYNSWNAYTKLDNPVMMRILWKLGAKPYHMDLEYNSIWFAKRLRDDI